MATETINDQTLKSAPDGTDEILVQETGGGVNKKITASTLLNRDNHTGTQLASTISDFSSAVEAANAVMDSDLLSTSAGAGDSGKPIKLDAGGKIDSTMLNSIDIDHDSTSNYVSNEHIDWTQAGAGTIHTDNYIEGGAGTDTTAIHNNSGNEIYSISEKASPVSGDVIIIEDSSDSYNKKRAQLGNLPTSAGEANTASNVGVGGVGVFKQKTGTDLEFKNINSGSAKITITDDTGNNEIDIDFGSVASTDLSDTSTLSRYADATANFTGTLQNGGSNVVVDTDIGSSVQAYDADTTKNDATNTFTADQTFSEETIHSKDIVLNEQSDHSYTPAAGKGQIWVRDDTPCVPIFTDDAGDDHSLLGGGYNLVSTTEPTSDVDNVTFTGLSAYLDVKMTFLIEKETSASNFGAGSEIQARASSGTWRTLYAFATSGLNDFAIGSIEILNFGKTTNAVKFVEQRIYEATSTSVDRSDANVEYTVTAKTRYLTYTEQWDELRIYIPNTIEGTTADNRAFVEVRGRGTP